MRECAAVEVNARLVYEEGLKDKKGGKKVEKYAFDRSNELTLSGKQEKQMEREIIRTK